MQAISITEAVNLAMGIVSLVVSVILAGVAIWLSITFYSKSKDTNTAIKPRNTGDQPYGMRGSYMSTCSREATPQGFLGQALMV
jgi:uncharacterized membrane protein YqiK